jgi:hypothetical protein
MFIIFFFGECLATALSSAKRICPALWRHSTSQISQISAFFLKRKESTRLVNGHQRQRVHHLSKLEQHMESAIGAMRHNTRGAGQGAG